MDAFAVAVATGVSLSPPAPRDVFRLAFHFGLFQFLMPICGWFAGQNLVHLIGAYDHWIAFVLLTALGLKMIKEAKRDETVCTVRFNPTKGFNLVLLSLATSIDALAAGLSLALLNVAVLMPSIVIGLTAAFLSACGMIFAGRLGSKIGAWGSVLGGIVLIVLGCDILVSHLSV